MPQERERVKPQSDLQKATGAMSDHILPGDPPVRVLLRRSARARRYSLRISGLDGRVTLTMPTGASERRALAFARDRADWIRTRLDRLPDIVPVRLGTVLPVCGVDLTVRQSARPGLRVEAGWLDVSARAQSVPVAVAAVLKGHARDRLVAATNLYAEALGRNYSRITLRDTRSRWGSCSSAGALMFSWRLVLAPPEVLDYVAAHEVAHLAEMNHGPRFWSTVGQLFPGYETPRGWLRANGEQLHRYRFTD